MRPRFKKIKSCLAPCPFHHKIVIMKDERSVCWATNKELVFPLPEDVPEWCPLRQSEIVILLEGSTVLPSPPDGGLGKLTEETREGQKRVRARTELEALCVQADETLGGLATVSAERNWIAAAQAAEDPPFVWVVRVEAEPVYLEARHPDLLVALGMAASAIKTEGV